KDIPGPKGVPIFGNLFTLMFKKNTYIEFEQEMENKYDPNFIKTSQELLGDGIFLAEGSVSYQQFQGKKFRNLTYASIIRKSEIVINALKKYADSENPIDLKDLFFRFTIDTIGDLAFGVDFGCLTHIGEESKFVTNFEYIQKRIHERMFEPFWKLTEKYSEKGQQMREALKYIDNYVYNMINSHRSELEVEKKPVNNMLTLLMDAVDDDGKKFNDKELKDIVMSLIIADSLLQEINSLLSTERPIPLYNDIKLFKYATATLYETLRLHPFVPVNGK
ncbi:2485_t:CDS:2, partial [Racocetra fulgida]